MKYSYTYHPGLGMSPPLKIVHWKYINIGFASLSSVPLNLLVKISHTYVQKSHNAIEKCIRK